MVRSRPKLKRLNAKHKVMAAHLAAGGTVDDAADLGGVNSDYLSSIRSDPLFVDEERRAGEALMEKVREATANDITRLRVLAVQALTDVLSQEDVFVEERGAHQRLYRATPSAVTSAALGVLKKTDPDRKAVEHTHGIDDGQINRLVAEALASRALSVDDATVDDLSDDFTDG